MRQSQNQWVSPSITPETKQVILLTRVLGIVYAQIEIRNIAIFITLCGFKIIVTVRLVHQDTCPLRARR